MKIKTRQLAIGSEYYNLEVHYDTKLAYFSLRGVPSDFSTFSPKWKASVGSATEAGLWELFHESAREYTKNKTSSRKVIVFDAHASAQILMNQTGPTSWSGYKNPKFKKLGEKGPRGSQYEVGFNFKIYTEVDRAGLKTYFPHEIGTDFKETGVIHSYDSKIGQNSTVIPYTDESFQFFVGLSKGFEKMVHQLANFFGEEDETKILQFIQNTPKLLG